MSSPSSRYSLRNSLHLHNDLSLSEATKRPGLEAYAKKRKELLEILNSFHSAGIQNDVELPQILVLGSQSVGKSSLLESMSGIKLPRDAGTCTRCPMECRLQTSPKWSCQISLRFMKDSQNEDLRESREVPFGEILYDKDKVERVLRRAQAAVLRPNTDPQQFLDDSSFNSHADRPLSFSENCVCLHVKGPDVPDLYFYDLPGIIANVPDGGDIDDISLVQGLAQKYISRKNCIILLAISCETDFENQGAARLILNDPALRQRTVGVLTKVDRIESSVDNDSAQRWTNIIKNKSIPLKNGWFAVRLPNQSEVRSGITREKALQNEKLFFATMEPWKSLSPRYKQNLGSAQLSESLSTILSKLVESQLPRVQDGISRSLHQANSELAKIPTRKMEDPQKEVVRLICDFSKKISENIKGLPPTFDQQFPSLMYAINGVYQVFRLEVHRTAPQFRPWKEASVDLLPQSEVDRMVRISSDDDAEGGNGTIMHVEQVMDLARRSRTRELPGNYPYAVRDTLINESTNHWRRLVNDCFEAVEDILTQHVNMIFREHFGNYVQGGLLDQVNSIMQEQISTCVSSARERLDSQCDMESEHYTQNEPYFYDFRKKILARYKALFRQSMGQTSIIEELFEFSKLGEIALTTPFGADLHAVLVGLEKLGIVGGKAEDLCALLPSDDLDPALDIMAEVRAYFQVAYKRFADVVPQIIDEKFVRAFGSSLEVALHMMDVSPENCKRFLEEAPEIKQVRDELMAKKARLEMAKDKLEKLFVSSPTVSSPQSARSPQTVRPTPTTSPLGAHPNSSSPTLVDAPGALSRSSSRSTMADRFIGMFGQ